MIRYVCVLFFCLTGLSTATANSLQSVVPESWQSSHFRDHLLVGKIYSGSGELLDDDKLEEQLSDAEYLLLGEIHDNPDHHRLQASFLHNFVELRRSKPAVIFEMVPKRLQTVLDTAKLSDAAPDGNLGKRLEWEERGWFSWGIYQPIFQAALEMELPLVAGSLDRAQLRSISKKGVEALTGAERASYALESELPAALGTDLSDELKQSHCGLLPEASIPAMMNIQRVKDGVMADAMIAANSGQGAILIAGNGHTRRDRGVPFVLKVLATDAEIVSVGMIEVSPEAKSFADYGLINAQGQPLYDLIVFTPKFDVTDHCAEIRKRFSKDKDDG